MFFTVLSMYCLFFSSRSEKQRKKENSASKYFLLRTRSVILKVQMIFLKIIIKLFQKCFS